MNHNWIAETIEKSRHVQVHEAWKSGRFKTQKDLAEEYGLSSKSVSRILNKSVTGKPLDLAATVRRMVLSGMSLDAIAKAMDRSQKVIKKVITELRNEGRLPEETVTAAPKAAAPAPRPAIKPARLPYTATMKDDPALAASLERLRAHPGILPRSGELNHDCSWLPGAKAAPKLFGKW